MPPKEAPDTSAASRKRKVGPNGAPRTDANPHKRPKMNRRLQQRDARTIAAQTSSKALKNGELDVDQFVKAREFEIRALEEGMSRSRKAQNLRAFQQVPKELRRRTASHNVKRVPKRLQSRARREMIEDNTPTVTARRRKPTVHQRLRLETAKRLRALGAKRKAAKETSKEGSVKVTDPASQKPAPASKTECATTITTRAPKVKKTQLSNPPNPKAKFRKRQFDKTWLPTHMFHAKRAHMTPPQQPLWGFALPLTPTVKSYRPTHRAVNERGAVAWDTSYVSTIGLEGQQRSLEGILKALGFGPRTGNARAWSKASEKWKGGLRVMEGWVFERESPHKPIAPVAILWAVPDALAKSKVPELDHRRRKLLLRVHPAGFYQLWEELVRLVKIVRPQANVEDLRYEIGSIEVSGPSATEALLGALKPSSLSLDGENGKAAALGVIETWKALAGLTNQSMLPKNVSFGFDIQDPRLHYPPRAIQLPDTDHQQTNLLETLASWPADQTDIVQRLFDRTARVSASSALPSQKSVNRRKALANPGEYPLAAPRDPQIPLLLYSITSSAYSQDRWVLLLPWKCVQPVWYSILYCPLTTGGQPRLGGVQEQRQLAFEAGVPWFPADFPATEAGRKWELDERQKRKQTWQRLPKSKRINWDSVDLGRGKKGEIGLGWACDWHVLFRADGTKDSNGMSDDAHIFTKPSSDVARDASLPDLTHISREQAQDLLRPDDPKDPNVDLSRGLVHVRIDLVSRGVPHACARIYRLPTSGALRRSWLDLRDSRRSKQKQQNDAIPGGGVTGDSAPPHVVYQRLAQSLLEPPRVGDSRYPLCPSDEDLIGFVTTGNFNLGEGRATGVGCILLDRVTGDVRKDGEKGRLCVIRNAGSGVGRLAKWCIV